LLTASEAKLEWFQATAHRQEENLLKRVQLTYQAERHRAHEHHQALSDPLRHQLGSVEHQLARLEALAESLVATRESPNVDETKRLLTEELPLPPPLPSPGIVQEAWERVCPLPRWKLSCDILEQAAKSASQFASDEAAKSASRFASGERDLPWQPEWPEPARAVFKGGTSLPMPQVDSASSGPEEFFSRGSCWTGDEVEEDSSSEDYRLPEDFFDSRRNQTSTSRARHSVVHRSNPENQRRRVNDVGSRSRCRDLSSKWAKEWLDSNQLHDLIETTAEIEAIRSLERRNSAAKTKRRLGIRS